MPVPPKRAEERRRNNSPVAEKTPALPGPVAQPPADESWHDIARDWYLSLALSGQARYYEPSDWQTARIWADVLSRQLNAGSRMSGQMMATWHSATGDLLTTEGARRKARIEVERAQLEGDAPAVTAAPKRDPKARLRAVPAS